MHQPEAADPNLPIDLSMDPPSSPPPPPAAPAPLGGEASPAPAAPPQPEAVVPPQPEAAAVPPQPEAAAAAVPPQPEATVPPRPEAAAAVPPQPEAAEAAAAVPPQPAATPAAAEIVDQKVATFVYSSPAAPDGAQGAVAAPAAADAAAAADADAMDVEESTGGDKAELGSQGKVRRKLGRPPVTEATVRPRKLGQALEGTPKRRLGRPPRVDGAEPRRLGRPPKPADAGEPRKRSRPAKGDEVKTPPKRRKGKEEEYVCFICFDGGDLVVCDRGDCPKVYHPSCVNRDEAYFRAKGIWTCGWHICSSCQKSARYMCYTCTFSLCKLCKNEAGFVRVRENKGFCATCMNIVITIESREERSKEADELDFDNESSWMYFFKDYWLELKQKLSFTLEELMRAKDPQKKSNAISAALDTVRDVGLGSSNSSLGPLKGSTSLKKKTKKRVRNTTTEKGAVREGKGASVVEDVGWATKELLELVAHMKGDDRSVLSQSAVQALLLEYIEHNNLRDPSVKSEIICDARLQNLFGKMRVEQFEMLKLLESHFLVKVPSSDDTDDNQEGVLDPDPVQLDTEGNNDPSTRIRSDRTQRLHNLLQEEESQTNMHDYAAIDVHNLTLIYMRRKLMEDLLDDIETFSDKVVGMFVRIRISGAGQGPDIYRLVQVVGTGRATKKYRSGKKNTDITLKILNLNKTEFIHIDIISNQVFSEEECKRLRQSVKCGFIRRFTVGEIREKARVIQAVRVTDWLENEKLRLANLRDRASEKGHRKELGECIEKLQLLSTPEERLRRLNEVPEIHVDPKMDPDYGSSDVEEDDKKPDNSDQTGESFLLRGNEVISSGKAGSVSGITSSSARESATTGWEHKNNTPEESSCDIASSTNAGKRPNESSVRREEQVQQTSSPQVPDNSLKIKSGPSSAIPCATISTSSLFKSLVPSNTSETVKMWHYKDPNKKVQGPFSLTQLRKWNNNGYFPDGLGIWRKSESEEDSILLTDALAGNFPKDLPELQKKCNIIAQNAGTSNMTDTQMNGDSDGSRRNTDKTRTDNNQNAVNQEAAHNDSGSSAVTGKSESMRNDGLMTTPSSVGSTAKAESGNHKDGRVGTSSGGWHSIENNSGGWHSDDKKSESWHSNDKKSGGWHSNDNSGGRHSNDNNYNSGGRHSNDNNSGGWHSNDNSGSRHSNDNNSGGRHSNDNSGGWHSYDDKSGGWQSNDNKSGGWHSKDNSRMSWQSQGPNSSRRVPPLSGDPQRVSSYNGRGDRGRWNGGQDRQSSWNPNRTRNTRPNNQGHHQHSNWSNSRQQPAGGQLNSPPGTNTSNQLRHVPFNLPTLQPAQANAQGSYSNFAPTVSSQHLNSGWGTTPGGNEAEMLRNASMGPSITASRTMNSVGGGGSNFSHPQAQVINGILCSVSSPSAPNAIRIPEAALSVKTSEGKQNIESACSSTNTGHEQRSSDVWTRPHLDNMQTHKLDGNNNSQLKANDSSVAENRTTDSRAFPPATCAESFQGNATTAGQATQSFAGLGGAPYHFSTTVSAPANNSIIQGPVIQANASAGWGLVTEGNPNVVWGIPAQGNPNLSTSWGTPVQANPSSTTGWGPPAQVEVSASVVSGTPTQGNVNQNTTWVAPAQDNTTSAPGWGASPQVNSAPNSGFGWTTQANITQNVSVGMPSQGNASASVGWVAGQGNPNPTWNKNTQQDQTGHQQSSQ